MNNRYKLVVFDWEGTLVDALGQVLQCINAAATALNYGTVDLATARRYVALGLPTAIIKLFPHLSTPEFEILLQKIQQLITLGAKKNTISLLPGAQLVVESLKQRGVYLAIASNKGAQSLTRALHHSGLQNCFTIVKAAGTLPPKPSPQMLEEILTECMVSNTDTLMIGDSISDMQMARSVNVDAIGIDFYNYNTEILLQAGALTVFNDYNKLMLFLEQQGRYSQ